ncbi:LysM peptidoglycan-binding domain-containing protein [Paenibacillus sp. IB182496]|uniref:LysM peptidoglycan-binding domain-containing protein n=1 Tax=Paenibacillus sabuli TaxID=2772509 RepID=A0A927BW65_9BACL|nr:LysM peptidoglycan-binding domain-containing protein [Paenibacillus sabuli]MBD2847976.1 LysM peptidoglycan-binding domain-containing protein [Paenibacillus sabuli]
MMNTYSYTSMHSNQARSAGLLAESGARRASSPRFASSPGFKNNFRTFFRIVAAFAVFVLLFAGFFVIQSTAGMEHPEPAGADEQWITVSAGDTLWDIAARVKPAEADIREIVFQLRHRNGLSSSSLQVGQRLIIPTSVEH